MQHPSQARWRLPETRVCPCCVHCPAHAGQCIVCLIPFLWVFESRYFVCFKNVKNSSSVLVCHFFFVCFKWFVWLIISAPFLKKETRCSFPLKYICIAIIYKQSYSVDGNNSHIKNAEKGREDPTIGETFNHLSKYESLNTICDKHIYVSIQSQQEIRFYFKSKI